jgi:nucleolar complex protein 3
MKFSSLLETFTSLNLDQTMEEGEKARQKIKLDRKKRRKAQDSIAKGLKEAEAIIDPNEKAKNQADILHEMVLIYFRFLKQQTVIVEKNEKNGGCFLLLPCILKGLSKFGCLIHLDIMIDLLKVLKVLLVQQKEFLPLNCSFEAVLTCLKTLQGPAAQELLIDEKEFIDILYHLFKCFIMFQEKKQIQNSFPIALECIEIIFLRRKEIILERVAAFIQRLLLICMHLHAPNQILSIMALVRKLMHRYTKVQQLLESDLDRVTSGEYRGEVDDPDFANPFANACWAFALLNHHYHPFVASFSLGTASLDPSLPNEAPLKLLENYHTFEVKGEFIPKITIPKPNSLHQKLLKNQKHQKYSKPIFIIPPKRSPSVFLTTCMATLQNQGMEEQQIDFASYHMKK